MSALWTPGRAGVSPGFLRYSPAPPSQVLLHRSLTAVCAGSRWSWFDSGPAPESPRVGLPREGREVLAEGSTYCTKAPGNPSHPRLIFHNIRNSQTS